MRLPNFDQESDGLGLTPLIDVVFLLLIFFLVATRFDQEERLVSINLAEILKARPVSMGPKEIIEPVAPWRKNLGQMMAPEVAGLLSRSLRTLPIRVERQNQTAQAVAEAMRDHPKVARVLYPGLPDFPQHDLARSQMSGFGGMLTLEIDGSGQEATNVVDRLELFIIAPSLGGPESLATQPMTTTHFGLTPEERRKRGITDAMIRFSIGMEAAKDLIEDLQNALKNM